MDAISIAPTPLEAMCAVATLDTLSLVMAEHVWVRRYAVSAWHYNQALPVQFIIYRFPAT